MANIRKDKQANLMYREYKKGLSLEDVGNIFNVARQSVYIMFKRRGFKLRTKKQLDYKYFNNKKYTTQSNGYFRSTNRIKSILLHRAVWEYYNGKIPQGYDIHHKDGNKTNNKINNLELLRKDEHARLHSTGHNQYTKKKGE